MRDIKVIVVALASLVSASAFGEDGLPGSAHNEAETAKVAEAICTTAGGLNRKVGANKTDNGTTATSTCDVGNVRAVVVFDRDPKSARVKVNIRTGADVSQAALDSLAKQMSDLCRLTTQPGIGDRVWRASCAGDAGQVVGIDASVTQHELQIQISQRKGH